MDKMDLVDEIVDLFPEIENGCVYGSLAVVVCNDGSYWHCRLDDGIDKDLEFRAANVQMQDALAESLLSSEELLIVKDDKEHKEAKMELEQPSQVSVESFNGDYYGTKQQIINEVMPGAFDAPWGSDFSL